MYYAKVTVYKVDKKLKFSQSIFEIEERGDNVVFSIPAQEEITLTKRDYFNDKNGYTVRLITDNLDLDYIFETLYKKFKKHFWYKPKYIKFLKSKLKQ